MKSASLLAIVQLFVQLLLVSSADMLSLEEVQRLKTKQLREMIADKGLECVGCSEKSEFVQMAFDAQSLESVVTPAEESPASVSPDKDAKIDKAEIDELMAKLKGQGFGNANFFSANDLKDLSPEELEQKFSGGNQENNPFRKAKKKSSKKDKKKKEATSDTKSKIKVEVNPENFDAGFETVEL